MYIMDKVSTDGWAHAWEDPSNKSYGEAHREGMTVVSWMGSKPMDGPIHGEFYPTNDIGRHHKHERANRRKIEPVATNGQGLWDISDPIKSKQWASPWVVHKSNPMADCVAYASPRRLGEAKPRWKTCSLSIWRLSSQPVEVSTVAIVDDSKAVDHISGANSCRFPSGHLPLDRNRMAAVQHPANTSNDWQMHLTDAVCQYMMARLHEEIVDGPRALPAISIPMQIACEADHILAVIIQAYRECVVIDKEGSILLWYLPNAISQAYQHSTSTEPEVTWNGGWRNDGKNFHNDANLKGAIDLSPAWFQQGHGVWKTLLAHGSG
ncbi:hypothetical protein BKA82DRAFT_4017600 [Pisolithus tinctorius]|nr:hypothetical protein BKA82DRAFT_4017600 [Pisolithus tinctorius]